MSELQEYTIILIGIVFTVIFGYELIKRWYFKK